MNRFITRPNKSLSDIIEVTEENKKLKKQREWILDSVHFFMFSSEKFTNAVNRAGIKTTRELISLNFLEVKAIKGIGIKAQQEIISYEIRPEIDTTLKNKLL